MKLASAVFHLFGNPRRLYNPSDEEGRQECNKWHHETIADIIHDIHLRNSFDTFFHTVINNQCCNQHNDQRKPNRRSRCDKSCKTGIGCCFLRSAHQKHQYILQNPTADNRIISHDQNRYQKRNHAKELPLFVHGFVSMNRAHSRFSSDRNICCQQCKACRNN